MSVLIQELQKFSLPQTKMLFIIYYFFKNEKIAQAEKFKLKGKLLNNISLIFSEFLILDNDKLLEILNTFEENENKEVAEVELLNELKQMCIEDMKFDSNDYNKNESFKEILDENNSNKIILFASKLKQDVKFFIKNRNKRNNHQNLLFLPIIYILFI